MNTPSLSVQGIPMIDLDINEHGYDVPALNDNGGVIHSMSTLPMSRNHASNPAKTSPATACKYSRSSAKAYPCKQLAARLNRPTHQLLSMSIVASSGYSHRDEPGPRAAVKQARKPRINDDATLKPS
ncbi:hypothetical protein H310_00275 [Aphanomyces invadans]|uniref:Uncharacterized protein n=1 Tax=Aphanomyces invadans TaxID=157072 RepID=A0A024UTF2_9STRA|nr:hypothetical protein H310_00275 [Aphanomyces invadans]ETW09796.1 hypothetical protein H310_00275 [Aphanomyces invadans]|eukprot:XP_008861207.1 hypothetical protein H310_00275 [Aphanomyces invadans]